jgi:hypothetical protein
VKTHELKTWPSFFVAVLDGTKTFECRKNDRDFSTGDLLILREFRPDSSPEGGAYTGRYTERYVGFVVLGGTFGVEHGHCVMALLERPA